MSSHTEDRPAVWLAGIASAIAAGLLSGSSCIIPDHGIVALVDCGASWCATAEFAEALGIQGVVQVQETQPDGFTGWVTACVCVTPADDVVLLAGEPPLQYELLRNQIIDAARQACPELLLAEGTSLRFAVAERMGGSVGLELQGAEPDTLAGRLGLRDHDVILAGRWDAAHQRGGSVRGNHLCSNSREHHGEPAS